MALYLGSSEKLKINLNNTICIMNIFSVLSNTDEMVLSSLDDCILKDFDGLYLSPFVKEEEN